MLGRGGRHSYNSSTGDRPLLARELYLQRGERLMNQSLFSQPLNVINVGIAMFSDDLKKQHTAVTQLSTGRRQARAHAGGQCPRRACRLRAGG